MSEQPQTPAPMDQVELEALVQRAAEEAVPLIPSPEELSVDASSEEAPGADAVAFHADYRGTTSGTAIIILSPAFMGALETGDDDTSVTELLTPVIGAIAETGGPAVPEAVIESAPSDVEGIGEAAFVALVADGNAVAWVGIRITATSTNPEPPAQSAAPAVEQDPSRRMELLRGVEMTLSVEIGRTRMMVRDLLQLTPGSVVELDRAAGSPADLLVNGRIIARGEVVVVDEEFGLRITELLSEEENAANQ